MSEIKNNGKVIDIEEIKNNGKVIDIEETKESKLKAKVSKVGESIKANRKKIIVAGANRRSRCRCVSDQE